MLVELVEPGRLFRRHAARRDRAVVYSGDETTEVRCDLGTPVSDEYAPSGNEFNGKIRWVQTTVDEASSDHLVHPEDRLRVIMARQSAPPLPPVAGRP